MGKFVDYVEKVYKGKLPREEYAVYFQLASEVDSQQRLIQILFDDSHAALASAGEDSSIGFRRRTLVRTLFAHIEATLSIMRQIAVRWYRLGAIKLSGEDLVYLTEELAIQGIASPKGQKPKHFPLKESVKFSFRLFGSTPGKSNVRIDTESPGWNSFCNAIKVRDALVHPKTEADLILAPPESEEALKAWMWFQEISTQAFEATAPLVLPSPPTGKL